MSVLDLVAQIGITIFGVSAIILVAKKNKWGFVLGIISCPFWFVTAYANKQWGVFFLNIIYTGTWIYGTYNWFHKKEPKQ